MKNDFATLCYAVVIAGFLSACSGVKDHPQAPIYSELEQAAINKVVLDYVEGWYSADAKRMEAALSSHLAKRRITEDGEIMAVSKAWMVKATAEGVGRIDDPERGRKEITILSQTETMASVMLVSNKFVDYLHLVKVRGSWKIANALWDYLPE